MKSGMLVPSCAIAAIAAFAALCTIIAWPLPPTPATVPTPTPTLFDTRLNLADQFDRERAAERTALQLRLYGLEVEDANRRRLSLTLTLPRR